MTTSAPRNRSGNPIPHSGTVRIQLVHGFGLLPVGMVLGQRRIDRLWGPFDPMADDGRQEARAILHSEVDTDSRLPFLEGRAIRAYHEVAEEDVVWPVGVGNGRVRWDAITALDRAGIVLVPAP